MLGWVHVRFTFLPLTITLTSRLWWWHSLPQSLPSREGNECVRPSADGCPGFAKLNGQILPQRTISLSGNWQFKLKAGKTAPATRPK